MFLDTFSKARDKLNDVTQFNLSEVATDFDEINKSSRKIRAAAKIYSSDEELESISELSQFTKFPSPPCSPNMFHSPGKFLDYFSKNEVPSRYNSAFYVTNMFK